MLLGPALQKLSLLSIKLNYLSPGNQKMNITDVRIRKVNGDTSLKALASVTIDNALVVHDIRIVQGKNGLFVAMPYKKVGDKYVDISHPITAQSRTTLIDTVLEEYRQLA